MKHLGDITKLRGDEADPVNVIIGGSPCQDLSVAGKRQGLDGERSGLFMDQIRVIREMRKADEQRGRKGKDIRPRFMVWENVPGAFSSNKGADFGAVLQETVRIVVQKAPAVPMPKKGWPTAGCISGMGDGGVLFTAAWRVFDAQFWGVPQRRRRIALVADFGGGTAPEILFEHESLPGDTEACGAERQGITADAGRGALRDDPVLGQQPAGFNGWKSVTGSIQYQEQICPTIEANMPPNVVTGNPTYCIQGNCIDRADTAGCHGKGWKEDISYTLNTIDRPAVAYERPAAFCPNAGGIGYEVEKAPILRTAASVAPVVVYDARGNGDGKIVPTITGDHENRITDYTGVVVHEKPKAYGIGNGQTNQSFDEEIIGALNCMHDQQAVMVTEPRYIVRRLTPLECERLQGFPDGWTDIGEWTDTKGKRHKESTDSARYKALGNSIALPPWRYVLKRLSLSCGADHTMGSLFDGIGGFPLIWEELNGNGSCLWASEIEEFPIAVTKRHFSQWSVPLTEENGGQLRFA